MSLSKQREKESGRFLKFFWNQVIIKLSLCCEAAHYVSRKVTLDVLTSSFQSAHYKPKLVIMVMWRDRHMVYKIGFCGLVLSVVAYIVSFSLPFWSILLLRSYGYEDQTIGLWQACLHQSLTCRSNVYKTNPPWLNASRALCSMALLFYIVSMGMGYYRNVSRQGQASQNQGRHVECTAIVATVVGAVGCVIFAAEFHRIYINHADVGRLYWAFGAVCSALCVAGFSACAMCAFNRKPGRRSRSSRRGTTTMRGRGPNGQNYSVHVQFPAELADDDRFHIPYFGEVTPDQLVYGATPLQPPAYDTVVGTGGGGTTAAGVHRYATKSYVNISHGDCSNYPTPSSSSSADDGFEAPPPYEEIAKDCAPHPVPGNSEVAQMGPSDAAGFSVAAATTTTEKDRDDAASGENGSGGNRN